MSSYIDESEFELRRILAEQLKENRKLRRENARLRRKLISIAEKRSSELIAQKLIEFHTDKTHAVSKHGS